MNSSVSVRRSSSNQTRLDALQGQSRRTCGWKDTIARYRIGYWTSKSSGTERPSNNSLQDSCLREAAPALVMKYPIPLCEGWHLIALWSEHIYPQAQTDRNHILDIKTIHLEHPRNQIKTIHLDARSRSWQTEEGHLGGGLHPNPWP